MNKRFYVGTHHQGASKTHGAGGAGAGMQRSFGGQPKGSFIYTGGKPVSGAWEPHRVNLRIM